MLLTGKSVRLSPSDIVGILGTKHERTGAWYTTRTVVDCSDYGVMKCHYLAGRCVWYAVPPPPPGDDEVTSIKRKRRISLANVLLLVMSLASIN